MDLVLSAFDLEEMGVDVLAIYGEMPSGSFGEPEHHEAMRDALLNAIREMVVARQEKSPDYAEKLLAVQKMYFYLQSEYDCEEEEPSISTDAMGDLIDLLHICANALQGQEIVAKNPEIPNKEWQLEIQGSLALTFRVIDGIFYMSGRAFDIPLAAPSNTYDCYNHMDACLNGLKKSVQHLKDNH